MRGVRLPFSVTDGQRDASDGIEVWGEAAYNPGASNKAGNFNDVGDAALDAHSRVFNPSSPLY